jgi:hypothetical protein
MAHKKCSLLNNLRFILEWLIVACPNGVVREAHVGNQFQNSSRNYYPLMHPANYPAGVVLFFIVMLLPNIRGTIAQSGWRTGNCHIPKKP